MNWISLEKKCNEINFKNPQTEHFSVDLTFVLKFSFSEKATKMCAIVLMVLTFTDVKTMKTIAHIFVAFSEKSNFTYHSKSGNFPISTSPNSGVNSVIFKPLDDIEQFQLAKF